MRNVNHIGVTVRDLDRAVRFYHTLLGTDPSFLGTFDAAYLGSIVGYPNAVITIATFPIPRSETFLELLEYRSPEGADVSAETCNPGNMHFCLTVDDLDREFDRLTANGVSFQSAQPVVIPIGQLAGAKTAYLRDPDGATVELFQPARVDEKGRAGVVE